MPEQTREFWVRKDDLHRLFSAPNLCYTIGGYLGQGNYGDIALIAATIDRVCSISPNILPVPLVMWEYFENHERLCPAYPSLFSGACFLYPRMLGDFDRGETARLTELVQLPYPPNGTASLLIHGGGILNELWGPRTVDLIQGLQEWISLDTSNAHRELRLFLSGQQVSETFLRGPHGDCLQNLFARATAIGLRDDASCSAIAANCPPDVVAKLLRSGDDATHYLLRLGDHIAPTGAGKSSRPAEPASDALPFKLNLHISLEGYVTLEPDRLVDIAVTVVNVLRQLSPSGLAVNLIVAYQDQYISEQQAAITIAEKIKASDPSVSVGTVQMIEELVHGFPAFGFADLTVCCSYHVALTSLILGIPTLLLVGSEYYAQKHRGLQREFRLPQELIYDVETGDPGTIFRALEKITSDRDFQANVRTKIANGSAEAITRCGRTMLLFAEFLRDCHFAVFDEQRLPGCVEHRAQEEHSTYWQRLADQVAETQQSWLEKKAAPLLAEIAALQVERARWQRLAEEREIRIEGLESNSPLAKIERLVRMPRLLRRAQAPPSGKDQ